MYKVRSDYKTNFKILIYCFVWRKRVYAIEIIGSE